MRSCIANDLECDRVVYFYAIVWDLVLSAIGSFRVWIYWMIGGISESILDRVRFVICFWSPLELIYTCAFFGIVSNFFCTTPLEVTAVFFLG